MCCSRRMLSWSAMWSLVWRTQSRTLQSFLLRWSAFGPMPGPRSASAAPGNTNSMTRLNSEWSTMDFKNPFVQQEKENTGCLIHFLLVLHKLPGQSRSDRGSRLPAYRAGHPENPSEDHWNRRNPLYLQKPPFQVAFMEPLLRCSTAHDDSPFVAGILSKISFRDYSSVSELTSCTFLPGCLTWEVRGQRGRSGSTALKMWRPLSSVWLSADTTRCSMKMKQP